MPTSHSTDALATLVSEQLLGAPPSRMTREVERWATDARWRLRCTREQWAQAVAVMAEEIDYDDFKSRSAYGDPSADDAGDPERTRLLGEVREVLDRLQADEHR